MKRVKAVAILLVLAMLFLAGCSDVTLLEYNTPSAYINAESGIVDKNENFTLSWDENYKCVLLADNHSGYIWSTTPYEFYKTGETGYSLSSPLIIDYYDPTDNSVQSEKAFESIDAGTVSSEIKDKKLYVSFYFTYPEITVTLCFSLNKDSLDVSFDSNAIYETGKTKLMNVTVAPYLCSVKNSADKNSYLFVPSGSGALMYTDDDPSGTSRDFSGEVFGNDPARTMLDNPADDEAIRLPCFGATNGKNGMLAIIKSEEGAARIDAFAGDSAIGYSNVCATFNIRGYNNFEWSDGNYHGNDVSNDVVMLYDTWPKGRTFKVGYYPLSDDAADYNGMANRYATYLKENKLLKESAQAQKNYQLTLVGGAQKKDFFFGVPYTSFLNITSFNDAKTICEELIREYKYSPALLLKGYGESGYDVGKIGGGFSFAPSLGTEKERTALKSLCENNDIPLYTDFNIIQFNNSANGFSTFLNSAQTANAETVHFYPKKKNIRTDDKKSKSIKFLSRVSINKAVDKLLDFANDNISGISLATLGNTAYSDYGYEQYMLKGDLTEQFKEIAEKISKDGHSLFLSTANSYAAGLSDGITDAPLQSGAYNSLDATIPFYELVYKGSIPLYSTPINLVYDSEKTLLRAIEAGVSPSFTVGNSLETSLTNNPDSLYYGISYASNKKLIKEVLEKTEDFYSRISHKSIKKHTIITSGVTKTEFDGGITVYVNQTKDVAIIEGKTVPAMSFIF